MHIETLLHIASVINQHSLKYEAIVPYKRQTYMRIANSTLETDICNVLKVSIKGMRRNHNRQSSWIIWEKDIEKALKRACLQNPSILDRAHNLCLTPQDVETIVRRATLQSLKLMLSPSPTIISGDNDNSHSAK